MTKSLGKRAFSGSLLEYSPDKGKEQANETNYFSGRYDLEPLKNIAKYFFGIEKDLHRYERPPVTP